jgi:AcrR family transcriptional regulator
MSLQTQQMKRSSGRPSEGKSDDSKAKILFQARTAFAQLGYVATTYRELQARTGYTSATLYHYFPSKIELYAAVLDDVTHVMYDKWILPGVENCITLFDYVDAFFSTVKDMHEAEGSLTLFVLGTRVDAQRHAEVAALHSPNSKLRYALIERIADSEIRDGVLTIKNRAVFIDTFDAITAGLIIETADPVRYGRNESGNQNLHRWAEALADGTTP